MGGQTFAPYVPFLREYLEFGENLKRETVEVARVEVLIYRLCGKHWMVVAVFRNPLYFSEWR